MSFPSSKHPLVRSSSSADLLPMMSNLLSATGESEKALRKEVSASSQALATFMEQMKEQFQALSKRNIELEGKVIAAQSGEERIQQMHLAQMQAIGRLTETINQTAAQMNERLNALQTTTTTLDSRLTKLELRFNSHNHYLGYHEGPLKYHVTTHPNQ
ncbi:MAG TPA: hypothetical protein DCE71_06205 [Parachlamydiales bacterium]|nr:hypothetical protein [Parachlamydiales bacterium]